jgi:hypothetical protein
VTGAPPRGGSTYSDEMLKVRPTEQPTPTESNRGQAALSRESAELRIGDRKPK